MALVSFYRMNWNGNDAVGSNTLTISWATSTPNEWINGSYSFADWNYMVNSSASWVPWWTADITYRFRAKWNTSWLSNANFDWGIVCWDASNANRYPLAILNNTSNSNSIQLAQHNWTSITFSTAFTVNIDWKWHDYVIMRRNSWTQFTVYEDWKALLDQTWVTARDALTTWRIVINWNNNATPWNTFSYTHSFDEFGIDNAPYSAAEAKNIYAYYRWFI